MIFIFIKIFADIHVSRQKQSKITNYQHLNLKDVTHLPFNFLCF